MAGKTEFPVDTGAACSALTRQPAPSPSVDHTVTGVGRQPKGERFASLLGFPGGTVVKNLPAMLETQETQVQSLGQEDSPGEGNGNPLQ